MPGRPQQTWKGTRCPRVEGATLSPLDPSGLCSSGGAPTSRASPPPYLLLLWSALPRGPPPVAGIPQAEGLDNWGG